MNELPLTQILNQLAEDAVPDDLDLRIGIHHRLEMSKTQPQKGVFSMKAGFARPRRIAALVTFIVLVLAAVFLFTPQGQTWAQSILGYFTYTESDTWPQETLIPGADSNWDFNLSIAEAEQRAGFDVLVPTRFPDSLSYSLSFREVSFDPQRKMVVISYDVVYQSDPSVTGSGIMLSQKPIPEDGEDCEICSLVGASAEIEEVQIGNISGEYVVGVWKAIGDTGQWGWVSDPYLQRLRWQSDGMAFELLALVNPDDLTKADLITIAESLQ